MELQVQQLNGRHHNSYLIHQIRHKNGKPSTQRVLDFLETLDIGPEKQDETKWGWKQIKMMFKGEDRQALQTLIDNNTIRVK